MTNILAPPTTTETLASLRRKAKMTIRQVGAAMGVTHPRVAQIENSGTRDVDQLTLLAMLYGVEFKDIQAANNATRNR